MSEDTVTDTLPRRLGRWDIVGVVAKRPSSTIVVGRASTGGVFARPVAIKLLKPELGRKVELVPQLLEATRVAASIRHSNVVQIQEIGQEGEHVFVVMDYLLGETAATVLRQLHSRGDGLDFTLGAYIVAEASAGLHAAHELGIQHEHLTPEDLFIGYDGTVKVLDIGVAAAAARLGAVRGRREIEYTSPESCRGAPLDRRTDIFSLGTILWELTTGLSPFERVTEADTIRAICEEPIVPPGTILRGLPEQVSKITVRALARDLHRRYATALALRQELLGCVRLLSLGVSSADTIALIMQRLFEARIRDKNELVKRLASGLSVAGLAFGEPDEDPSVSNAKKASEDATAEPAENEAPDAKAKAEAADKAAADVKMQADAELPASPRSPGKDENVHPVSNEDVNEEPAKTGVGEGARISIKHALVVAWAAGALLALLVIVVLLVVLQTPTRPPATTLAKAASPTHSALVLRPEPSAVESDEPSAPAPPASSAGEEPPATSSSASPIVREETIVHIETVPPRAMILLAGAKKGVSPMALKLPKSDTPVVIEIRHAGYQPLKERLVPDVNQKLRLTMVAIPGHKMPATPSTIERFD